MKSGFLMIVPIYAKVSISSLPRKIIKSTFFFVIFGYGLLIVSADWLVPLVLGEQWRVATV
jgi:hypothetical protein